MSPSDRLLVLSQLVDELPAGPSADLVRVFAAACFAVVRHMQGRATEAEARFSVSRAGTELRQAVATAATWRSVLEDVSIGSNCASSVERAVATSGDTAAAFANGAASAQKDIAAWLRRRGQADLAYAVDIGLWRPAPGEHAEAKGEIGDEK